MIKLTDTEKKIHKIQNNIKDNWESFEQVIKSSKGFANAMTEHNFKVKNIKTIERAEKEYNKNKEVVNELLIKAEIYTENDK